MPSYSPTTSKYVLSAAKTRDPTSDMPTYSPSDLVRHPTYEPTSQSTDSLHSPIDQLSSRQTLYTVLLITPLNTHQQQLMYKIIVSFLYDKTKDEDVTIGVV